MEESVKNVISTGQIYNKTKEEIENESNEILKRHTILLESSLLTIFKDGKIFFKDVPEKKKNVIVWRFINLFSKNNSNCDDIELLTLSNAAIIYKTYLLGLLKRQDIEYTSQHLADFKELINTDLSDVKTNNQRNFKKAERENDHLKKKLVIERHIADLEDYILDLKDFK
jgi:hypothetical protein